MKEVFTTCSVCKKPWNTGGSPYEMACNDCCSTPGIDINNFDHSVDPKENFYMWSNGGWMANNPIPGEYSSWNTFIQLRDLNLDRLKKIVDDLLSGATEVDTDNSRKLSKFFKAMMDSEEIESKGIAPILPIIDLCKTVQENTTHTIATLHAHYGVDVLFSLHSTPDKKDAGHTVGMLYQGGLGLLDRDYYIDDDKADKREKYLIYVEKVFALLGRYGLVEYATEESQKAAANDVFQLEMGLAESHLTRTECRDPELTYNMRSVEALNDLCAEAATKNYKCKQHELAKSISWAAYLTKGIAPPEPAVGVDFVNEVFDWSEYFKLVGKEVDSLGNVNVATLSGIERAFQILCISQSRSLHHYLIFHTILSFSDGHLPDAFQQAHFDFFEMELKGTAERKPRWKTVLAQVETSLGEALGEFYVAKFFPDESKQRALRIVHLVRDALRERLLEIEWMGESTRAEAIRKMDNFRVKIGFPNKWIDYSTLKLYDNDHIKNVLSSRQFNHRQMLERINSPTDRERWFMTPQTVNAYYHPSLNEIVFPAAILQPPFFNPDADDAVNFGSLGAVVGHEMTHGFDDQGRKYDSCGTMRDWWSEEDAKEYEARVEVMINQAGKFEVYGKNLNGKFTCGENIADLGGVKLALRALKKHLADGIPQQKINGFTPEQRLFLAWSQIWRQNVKKERAIQLVTLDPHGPNELRCNGTLSNIQDFYDVFNISSESAFFVSESERVNIW